MEVYHAQTQEYKACTNIGDKDRQPKDTCQKSTWKQTVQKVMEQSGKSWVVMEWKTGDRVHWKLLININIINSNIF